MISELELEARLGARIKQLSNELAVVKAFKSVLSSTGSLPSTQLPRITGPKKAA
jgi:hypothetical protein